MDSFPFSSKPPTIDTPVCDSDEEVFFGPVTSKELQKASQLKRRTQLFFPSFDWKPRISPSEQSAVPSSKAKDTGVHTVSSVDIQPVKLSMSADSLESQSFLTSSERPEESSKGEYWSALSGDSSGSHSSLNEGHLYSKLSADSLESDQAPSTVKKCPPKFERHEGASPSARTALSFNSNISQDSLEGSSKHLNDGRLISGFSEGLSSSELKSSVGEESLPSHSEDKLQNVTYIRDEIASSNQSNQFNVTQVLSDSFDNESESAPAVPVPNKLSDAFGNNTYSLDIESDDSQTNVGGNESDDCQVIDPESGDSDVPVVIPDKDGGFLSILSEAALYHASQLKENDRAQCHGLEESVSTTQSLEDRFKVFGIDAGDLEEQQLSNSIMYTTGRESNVRYSEVDNNTFYTGRNSTVGFSRNFDGQTSHDTISSVNDLSSVSSLGVEQLSSYEEQSGVTNMSTGSQVSAKSESNVLNQPIHDSASSSTGSSLQDINDQQQVNIGSGTLNDSSRYQRESLHISGVYPLNSQLSENFSHDEYMRDQAHDDVETLSTADEDFVDAEHDNSGASSYACEGTREISHNDSGSSSNAGELNDTLEEYEMMMKYGVDYILGRKGNKKERNPQCDSGNGHQSPVYMSDIKSSSGSSVEFIDAVEVPPNKSELTRVQETKVGSPLQKQVLKTTPVMSRNTQGVSSKTGSLKMPSKLPRAASAFPSKPLLTPSPQKMKLVRPMTYSEPRTSSRPTSRPITPSSEAKLNTFKKPVAPAIPVNRLPKTPKSNNKILEKKIQSPVGAYIHNSPLPVLVTNVKAKTSDRAPHEREIHAKALWRAGEMKSSIPRPGNSQAANCENLNPNVGCGLPAVKYTKAPCIKLDEASKSTVPRVGEKMTKLLDAPCPQVIKHEGRLRVNCGSPQLAAKMQSMADIYDDSLIDIHSVSGDISVCVSQTACRTNTLGH